MPVPLHATIQTRAGRPEPQALLDAILADLSDHGVTPSPLAILAAATHHGADQNLAAEVAAILQIEKRESHHATRRKAGGIRRG